jgi:CDP-diacylglycerol---serine O-phosphatidyltransferase
MRRLRTVAVFPTLFTLGNLLCGFFALVVAARVEAPISPEAPMSASLGTANPVKIVRALDRDDPNHNMMLCGWLVFLAMIFDALDGQVARLARSTSDFGAQLDSLADMVTFGVAPAMMLVKMCPRFAFFNKEAVWIIAASFVACVALRLARFNAETSDDDDHMHFSGLPSPAGAASIAAFALLFYTLRREDHHLALARPIDDWVQMLLPLFAVLVALLMVSRIPYPHLVNQILRGQLSFAHVVGLLFAILAMLLVAGYAAPLACLSFVLLGPIRYAWQELVERRPHDEPMF